MYIYVDVSIYLFISMYLYLCIYIYVSMYLYLYLYPSIYLSIYQSMYIYIVYIYIYAHTHTHITHATAQHQPRLREPRQPPRVPWRCQPGRTGARVRTIYICTHMHVYLCIFIYIYISIRSLRACRGDVNLVRQAHE